MWQVSFQAGEVIWSIFKVTPPYIWWPTLNPDFCKLPAVLDTWDISDTDPQSMPLEFPKRFSPGGKFRCGSPEARCQLGRLRFYILHSRDQAIIQHCGGLESVYYSAWGCEPKFHTPRTLSYSLVTFDIWTLYFS